MSVTSTYVIDTVPQSGGYFYVVESHTDPTGTVHTVGPYLVTQEADVAAKMALHAETLELRLAEREVTEMIESNVVLNIVHQTGLEFAARFWRRVFLAFLEDKVEFCHLIWWIANKVAAGEITDAAARSTFNTEFGKSLTVGEWNTLKTTRFVPARDRYQAILDEVAL